MVRAEAARLGLDIKVEKVTDYAAIASFGVVSTPGIVIDGKVVHAGGLPKPEAWYGRRATDIRAPCLQLPLRICAIAHIMWPWIAQSRFSPLLRNRQGSRPHEFCGMAASTVSAS